MITIRIQLTPAGHYFLGSERGFGYDPLLKRQMSERYFISSLKIPSQTTLFGVLRYLIGVKNEKLIPDSDSVIGRSSFDITNNNDDFGIITSISPLYLYDDSEYYIRTPFDHKIAEYKEDGGDIRREEKKEYTPMKINRDKEIDVINYPAQSAKKRCFPDDYKGKDGISKSFISLVDKRIVKEDDIFVSSVEVVSKKNKIGTDNKDGFAKKEYIRLKKGWSFVYYAKLDADKIPDYNKSVVIGKDSSVFHVDIKKDDEPDVNHMFSDRGCDFHYFQSPAYIKADVSKVIDKRFFCIIENENLRKFKTENFILKPEYNANLIQLISAGSIIYSDDVEELRNAHASIAGFNRIIDGGKKQ